MENKQSLLSKILFNNKIMLIISLVLSFVIWVGMCMNNGEEITQKITGIPITVELSDEAVSNGLKNFTVGDITAEVTVKGNRLSVGALSAADVEVVATQALSINSPGTYTLELSARKIGLNTNYELTSSVYPSSVIVTIDRLREISYPIINNLDYSIAEGYYEGTTQYSSSEILVSGPETEVSRIDKIAVKGSIEDELKETTTVSEELVILDKYGEVITSDRIVLSQNYVDVTIPVDYKKTLDMKVELLGVSESIKYGEGIITLSPTKIEVAGPYDELKDVDEVVVAKIDMSKITPAISSNTVQLELPATWKNISNISSVNASFDLSGYSIKTFRVTKFDTSGCSVNSSAKVSTQSIDVTVVGPLGELESLTSSDLNAIVDFGNKASGYSGAAELGLTVDVNDEFVHCWVFGNYNVSVVISSRE